MNESRERLATTAANAATASAQAYEKYVVRARTPMHAHGKPNAVDEARQAKIDTIPSAVGFRHGEIRVLKTDDARHIAGGHDPSASGAEVGRLSPQPDAAARAQQAAAASAAAYERYNAAAAKTANHDLAAQAAQAAAASAAAYERYRTAADVGVTPLPDVMREIARLEEAAKATAQAAYDAYHVGHGRRPAVNARELLAAAVEAQRALAKATRG